MSKTDDSDMSKEIKKAYDKYLKESTAKKETTKKETLKKSI